MARFGRDFVRAATQPAYLEGLFTAAQDIGSLPARAAAAQQQASLQKGLFGLEQMALSGDLTPEMYKEAVGSYTQLMKQNPAQADEIRKSLASVGASVRQQSKQQNQITAKTQLENLKQAAVSVQLSEGLTPEQKKENLARFRVEAQKIVDANPNVDLTAYSNFGTDVETSVYQLDKLRTTQETTTAVEGFSSQLFQIADYDTLQTTTDTLLKANPEYAEEIKQLANVQQTSIENREQRERAEEERKYDIGGSVDDIKERGKDLPVDIQQIINDNLDAAVEEQKKHRNVTGWTNTAARDRARALIRRAEQVADDYIIRREANKMVELRGIDDDIQTLLSQGAKTVTSNEVENLAEELSLTETGKKLSDISSKQRSNYVATARSELVQRNNAIYNSELATARRRRADITGEQLEEPEKTEEAPKFLNPVSKEAVEAARAKGQTDKQIIDSLKALGASNDKIISLL